MAIKSLTFQDLNAKIKRDGVQFLLLDVREKGELVTDGKIAGSRNIPVGEIPTAIKMDDSVFEEKYGFPKPPTEAQIVIHCKAGVRAETAAKVMISSGYEHVEVYPGILDWVKNGGTLEK